MRKLVMWNLVTLDGYHAADAVRELKPRGDRNMFVFGSAHLSATLADEGLFDEYRRAVVPVVLGSGHALFGHNPSRQRLTLLGSQPLSSGAVILRYAPIRDP